MPDKVLMGNEAVALGALHAGISAAYSYPGTPATEIVQYIMTRSGPHGKPVASWTANEKTAYDAALGVSMAGGRALVAMKHVGLNVAADSFINSALTTIRGGLVIAVADDPGMHSSQNEQDSRFYADFAKIICLEPSNQQEAYTMTLQAFDLSERFHIPVMLRLVTRLSHSRSNVTVCETGKEISLIKEPFHPEGWVLLPSISRRLWKDLVTLQDELVSFSENASYNTLKKQNDSSELGIITAGIAKHYYLENLEECAVPHSHCHIGMYPFPLEKIRALAQCVNHILVLEEGYPFIEKYIRGIIPPAVSIAGRMDQTVPETGELSPDSVRTALGLPARTGIPIPLDMPARPPQFCYGCPHIDSYTVLDKALQNFDDPLITSDIGCYTLGALPPYSLIHSTVCMGSSIGMAKGAADTGKHPVIAVIGDSTFLHSGITSLMDAVAGNTNMTLIILDNEVVAMTGAQPTIVPSQKLRECIIGLGVDRNHCHVLQAEKASEERNISLLQKEISFHGLSVVIMHRECIVAAKRKMRKA